MDQETFFQYKNTEENSSLRADIFVMLYHQLLPISIIKIWMTIPICNSKGKLVSQIPHFDNVLVEASLPPLLYFQDLKTLSHSLSNDRIRSDWGWLTTQARGQTFLEENQKVKNHRAARGAHRKKGWWEYKTNNASQKTKAWGQAKYVRETTFKYSSSRGFCVCWNVTFEPEVENYST